ncbi:MAG: hypothetical protein WB683_05320 [Candidatus Sulfotelmatobacter sp.]
MNRKLYAISLAAVFLAISFLTSCSSSSSTTPPPPPPASTTPFAFYLSGQEEINEGPNYYALAGAVTIDASGNVTAGEQDYNDGFGITSPEPSGDSITGGTLTVDATGQGTLTLITNNTAVGASGTETLGVQFVNADHALITQFDGSATSSGSMDLQTTLSSTPSGAFAFTISGVDASYNPIAVGGVFTLPSATTDEVDANDNGDTSTQGVLLTVSLGAPDAFGRGVLTSSLEYGSTGILFNYYVVGPEVIRIIDVDPSTTEAGTDSAVGSAFGQGTNATAGANASLGASIFGVSGDPFGFNYATAGEFVTNATNGSFSGVGEDAELGTFISGAASVIGGPYSIAANGYGSLTINGFGADSDVSAMQVYATDPTLDLMDPNNANGNLDLGGALLLDFDAVLAGGTGVVVSQTDTTATDFNGTYTAGWQDFNNLEAGCAACEFDMIANGTMTSGGALSLTEGEVSDPFETLNAGATTITGATFTGQPTPDATNPGRLTLLNTDAAPGGALIDSIGTSSTTFFDAIIYQASASQLFWLEFDLDSVFLGSLEEQGSLTGVPAVKRPAKVQAKR